MGQAHLSKGQHDAAMSYYQEALDKITAASTSLPTSGSVAIELAEIYLNIGQLKHERGDLKQAGEYYHKALRLQYRTMRHNHPRVVETLIHLARLQRDSGASEDSVLAALANAETLLTGRENHREFARVLMLKADLLRISERFTDAEAAVLRALEIEEGLGSQETPELAITLNILGQTLQDQDRYGDAEKQFARALAMNMETVGSNHPDTSLTYNNLGYLYQHSGDNIAAERCYRKSAEIQKVIYARDTLDMAATYNNIATILVGQGRISEAKELLAQAVHIVRIATLPVISPERAAYEQNLQEVEHLLARSIQSEPVEIQRALPQSQMV